MPIRSMTGFAQIRGAISENGTGTNGATFTLSLKSVNHRQLDLHFRLPSEKDALEIKIRRVLKERVARGHVDISLHVDYCAETLSINKKFVGGYVEAFRAAANEFGISAEPDLNAVLRLPGALQPSDEAPNGDFENAVLHSLDELLIELNRMRELEGRGVEQELRQLMEITRDAFESVKKIRDAVPQAYAERLRTRMQELFATQIDPDRILQEAALLADRSDVQEELVRLDTHVQHFLGLLDLGGEVGKKLDFLLQEMNREANTLLSKTSGLTGDALKITEMGLAMKASIEKAREQVQNVE